MAEQSGRNKLSSAVPPYAFHDLPAERNDNDWNVIASSYNLTLAEKNALKNARCSGE